MESGRREFGGPVDEAGEDFLKISTAESIIPSFRAGLKVLYNCMGFSPKPRSIYEAKASNLLSQFPQI